MTTPAPARPASSTLSVAVRTFMSKASGLGAEFFPRALKPASARHGRRRSQMLHPAGAESSLTLPQSAPIVCLRGGPMSRTQRVARILSILLVGGLSLSADSIVRAQQPAAQRPQPEGYVPRGTRPGKGLAPGMKVTDLGKGARTFRINLIKGDEVLSGMT